jgi:L-rhamnose isomerase
MGIQPTEQQIHSAYLAAKDRYAALNVDTDKAMALLSEVPISLHCWQGDDVGGFESPDAELSGGIAATGNYPGKARTADDLRRDLDLAVVWPRQATTPARLATPTNCAVT